MSKHTPGPWKLSRTHVGTAFYIDGDSGGERDLRVEVKGYAHPDDGITVANARLIAAAPDLLSLAQTFHELLLKNPTITKDYPHLEKIVRDTILKANGWEAI